MSIEIVPATPAEPAAADRLPRRRTAWLIDPVAGLVADPAVRQGAWSVVDQAVVSAAGFVTGLIVARATSKPEFGVYYLALTLVLFARGIQSQLVTAPYMIFCHRRHGRALAEYTGSSLVHQLVLSAAAMAGVLGFALSIELGLGPRNLLGAIGALLLAMPLLLLREFGRNHALSNLKTIAALVLDGTAAAVQLGLLAALWIAGLLSVAGAYFVMAAAAAIGCGQWLWMERGRWRVARARILPDWRDNWRLARWALASHLVGCTTPYIMPWILAVVRSQADTGLLGACGTLAGVANLFVMGLSNFLAPAIARAYSRGGKAAMCRVVVRALGALGIIVGGICLLSLVAGEYFVVLVYGSQYAGGGPVLTLCLLALLGTSLSIVAGNGLWVLDRPHETFLPDVIAMAAALGTAALMVPSHGAMGAALAMLAGTTSGSLLKALRFVQLVRKLPGQPPFAPEHCENP